MRAAALRVVGKLAPNGHEDAIRHLIETLHTDDSAGVCVCYMRV